jgi:hypothetical protein
MASSGTLMLSPVLGKSYVRTQETSVNQPLHTRRANSAPNQENVDQTDEPDYEGVQKMANGNTFEPGPSFVDNDQPSDRLTEMPAWLQSFAAQESKLNGEDQDVQIDPPVSRPEEPRSSAGLSPDLPDWLKDEPAEAAQDDALDEAHSTEDVFENFEDTVSNPDGFISEDDLPDWLRAFSDGTGTLSAKAPDVSRVIASRPAVAAGSTMVKVPPVENVWLTSVERNALGPGGTLFALLAANGSADSGATHQPYIAYETEPAKTSHQHTDTVSRDADPQPVAYANQSGTDQPAVQANSMRLILLTLVIVMLVIAISVWQFS